jgi:hypothetical protein
MKSPGPWSRTGAGYDQLETYCGVKFWWKPKLTTSWNMGVPGGRLFGFRNCVSKK